LQYPPTKTSPWNHQKDLWQLSKDKPNFYIAHDMGCGKTKESIDYANGINAEKILVISPKKVTDVWPAQFKMHSAKKYEICSPDKGTAAKKAKTIEAHLDRCKVLKVPSVVVLNYEIVIRPPLGPVYDRHNRMIHRGYLLTLDFDLLVIDEAHRIKAPGGKASWNIMRIGKHAECQRYQSGTPMPHSPLDIYAQYRALDNTIFGTRYDMFKQRYAIMGGYENKQVVRFVNLDELNEKFYSIAHYVSSDDALDLPEESDHILTCKLPPRIMKLYNEFNKELIIEIGNGEVTAQNGLVKLLRLAQMTAGYMVFDDDSTQIIDDAKIRMAIDFLVDLPEKKHIVIFCRFQNEIVRLKQLIESNFKNRKVGTICGFLDSPKDFYDGIWHGTDTNTLIVQVQAGGEGIDLTVAHYCLFFSKDFSLGNYRQCKKRLHRPGQTKKTFYYHIICQGTVDQKIMTAIEKKRAIVDYILEDLNPHKLKN
jgi:SNF2 family DNA or RNA helicase